MKESRYFSKIHCQDGRKFDFLNVYTIRTGRQHPLSPELKTVYGSHDMFPPDFSALARRGVAIPDAFRCTLQNTAYWLCK